MINRLVKYRSITTSSGNVSSLFNKSSTLNKSSSINNIIKNNSNKTQLLYNNNFKQQYNSYCSNSNARKKDLSREAKELEAFVKSQTQQGGIQKPAQPKAMNRKERRTMEQKLQRNSNCLVVAGVVSPKLTVPENIPYPPYAKGEPVKDYDIEDEIPISTKEDIEGMRASCKVAKSILEFGGKMVKAGVTTDEIDRAVHEEIIRLGAYPSTLGYKGYPKSVCTSINEVICHGIPDNRPLQDGDIINIDVTVYYKGYHGDTSATFKVGEVDPAATKLIEVTKMALDAGIKAVKPKAKFSEIGKAIQAVAHKHSYSIPIEFTAHGIGKEFHTPPFIFQVANDLDYVIEKDMIFTIEPILVESTKPFTDWKMWDDNWTISSKEGGWSAQFEHTILVTENGAEILTQ